MSDEPKSGNYYVEFEVGDMCFYLTQDGAVTADWSKRGTWQTEDAAEAARKRAYKRAYL